MKDSFLRIYSLLDITRLEGTDTRSVINRFVSEILHNYHTYRCRPAAVCVFPVFAIQVRDLLLGTEIKTACVAGAFPHGQLPLHMKADEVKFALDAGADEIDYVINRGRFLEDGAEYLFEEVAHIRQVCGQTALLKVILETGELEKPENMKWAAAAAIKGGADFVKTSTGKSAESATLKSVEMLCEAVKDHFLRTGIKIGIKPAGGISEPEDAERYIQTIIRGTGPEWIHPKRMRIGASRLALKLLQQENKDLGGY
jgi:deoxyribose-phosphate aldolase